MKGIEGGPFLILASAFILAISVSAGAGFLLNWLAATSEANFREDVIGMWQVMGSLTSGGDRGSWRTVVLSIPACCSLNISIDNDILLGVARNQTFGLSAPGNITNVATTSAYSNGTVQIGPGRYEFRIFYGTPEILTNWTIVFQ